MDLQTTRQVSIETGISARMLRYYEQMGLIQSSRKDDYAYRVYDETALGRLRQILILRKLQIPIKQIRDILDNPEAVNVIEIFKQNMDDLDEKITALSTVKSILARFVDELQEKTDVQLKIDLLNDQSMVALVDALSVPMSRVKEKVEMEELNRASKTLSKEAEKSVRIVYRPPSVMATLNVHDCEVPTDAGSWRQFMEAMARKFIEETDLFKKKPDMRMFGFDNGDLMDTMWLNVPDDLEVPAPWKRDYYPGGLYAACKTPGSAYEWVENSDEYEWDVSQGPGGVEYFNPFNIYGLSDSETAIYIDDMCPIRKIKKWSDEQANAEMAALDQAAVDAEAIEIELSTIELRANDEDMYALNRPNGLIELKVDAMSNSVKLYSPRRFNLPVKIDLRAKTDKDSIIIGCAQIAVIFKWCGTGVGEDSLCIYDQTDGKLDNHKKCSGIPAGKFVDIELYLTKDGVAIRVDGELRHYGSDYNYVSMYEQDPRYSMNGEVYVGTENGSTITVERLRVTELNMLKFNAKPSEEIKMIKSYDFEDLKSSDFVKMSAEDPAIGGMSCSPRFGRVQGMDGRQSTALSLNTNPEYATSGNQSVKIAKYNDNGIWDANEKWVPGAWMNPDEAKVGTAVAFNIMFEFEGDTQQMDIHFNKSRGGICGECLIELGKWYRMICHQADFNTAADWFIVEFFGLEKQRDFAYYIDELQVIEGVDRSYVFLAGLGGS